MTSSKPSPEDEDEGKGKDVVEDGDEEEIESIHSQSRKPKGNGSGKFSATPGPSYTGPPLPTPHYNNVGHPHKLDDPSDFANWQFLMRSHLSGGNTELWRIVEEGFYPVNVGDMPKRQ